MYIYMYTQCCYPLIDHILQGGQDGVVSLVTQCTDVLAVDNQAIIKVGDAR